MRADYRDPRGIKTPSLQYLSHSLDRKTNHARKRSANLGYHLPLIGLRSIATRLVQRSNAFHVRPDKLLTTGMKQHLRALHPFLKHILFQAPPPRHPNSG